MDSMAFLATLRRLHTGRKRSTPEHLSPAQLSARWDGLVAVGTLANWRCMGRGPASVRFAGRILYATSAVVAWERAQLAPFSKGSRRGG